jgi:hypothetical protein
MKTSAATFRSPNSGPSGRPPAWPDSSTAS